MQVIREAVNIAAIIILFWKLKKSNSYYSICSFLCSLIFCRSWLHFYWPLHYLSFFDLWRLITSLISSNFSYRKCCFETERDAIILKCNEKLKILQYCRKSGKMDTPSTHIYACSFSRLVTGTLKKWRD